MFWKRLRRIVLVSLPHTSVKLLSWVACTLAREQFAARESVLVERIARDERDLVHVLVLGNFDGQQGGIAAQRSQFRSTRIFWTGLGSGAALIIFCRKTFR